MKKKYLCGNKHSKYKILIKKYDFLYFYKLVVTTKDDGNINFYFADKEEVQDTINKMQEFIDNN